MEYEPDWHLDDNQENEEVFIIEVPDDGDYETYDIERQEGHVFGAGEVRVVPSAQEVFVNDPEKWRELLDRHLRCDYGDMPLEDWQSNNYDLLHGGRVLSRYNLELGDVYIETWPELLTVIKEVSDY